jgi:hypothetical protein
MFINRISTCFTNKHSTRLESLAWNKHSRLLRKYMTYASEKFYNIGQRDYL